MVNEYNTLDRLTLDNLSKKAPLIHAQLAEDAETDEEAIEEHLTNTSLDEYLRELISWCHSEIAKLEREIERYPSVAALSEKAKEKLRIPWQKLDVLNKYQTILDNQLYKALRAIREAQEWRMNTIDATLGYPKTQSL